MPPGPPPNRIATACAVLACLVVLVPADAVRAAPPANLSRYTTMSGQPSAADRGAITEYAEHWAEALGSDDPVQVGKAYHQLEQPANAPGATMVFRSVYSDALIKKLRAIVDDAGPDGERSYQPVNAMKVACQLGTEDALQLMVDHFSKTAEPRASVRLWAAIGFRVIVERDNAIQPRRIVAAIRRLGEAAAEEDVPWVLVAQFEALKASNQLNTVDVTLDVIDKVTNRLKQQKKASELFIMIQPAVLALRDRLLQGGNKKLALELAPRLANLLEVAEMHWPPSGEQSGLRPGYEETIKVLEQNLQAVDARVNQSNPRLTNTTLEKSFREDNREDYRNQLLEIQHELEQPPYR